MRGNCFDHTVTWCERGSFVKSKSVKNANSLKRKSRDNFFPIWVKLFGMGTSPGLLWEINLAWSFLWQLISSYLLWRDRSSNFLRKRRSSVFILSSSNILLQPCSQYIHPKWWETLLPCQINSKLKYIENTWALYILFRSKLLIAVVWAEMWERKENFSSSMRDLFQVFYRKETWQLKKIQDFLFFENEFGLVRKRRHFLEREEGREI